MTIYLDNAATSHPKPESVYCAIEHTMREIGVGPGRGSHRRGLDATRLVFAAREEAARLIGTDDSSRIVFTHSATEALNLAVAGLLKAGDHVVTTSMEHNSLARPLYRAEQQGVEVTRVTCGPDGLVNLEALAAALCAGTRLVAFAHVSNVTGTIQPVGEICNLARRAGALVLLDAAQSAGSIPIDVHALGIDLLAAPGHKGLYGPTGTGFLYVGEGVDLNPLMTGGTGGSSAGPEQPAEMPERFESGTPNVSGIAGLKAGLEFIREVGVEAIRSHEAALCARLRDGLSSLPGLRLYGPADPAARGSVVSLTMDGIDPAQIGYSLDQEFGIEVRVGLHCAPGAHRTIGTFPAGTVRISPGYFNTEKDVEMLLSALHVIAHRAGTGGITS
jgi:cysteine desulfurase family protein